MFSMEWSISCLENNKNKGENPKGIAKKSGCGRGARALKNGVGGRVGWVGAWSNEKSSNRIKWPIKNVQSSLRSAGIFSRGWQP